MDLIDRQAAIDEIENYEVTAPDYMQGWAVKLIEAIKGDIRGLISELPSVEPEIVRCKDCKHRPAFRYDDDGDRYVEGPRYPETLKNGHTFMFEDGTCPCVNEWDSYFSYIPKDDWFCANGERREEE